MQRTHRTEPSPLEEPDHASFDTLTSACTSFVRDHIGSLGDQPSNDLDDASRIAATFREAAPEAGSAIDDVLARLRPAIAASFNTAGPGYMAFIPGGGVYAAALADYVSLAVNRFVPVSKAAPALAQIEATTIAWLASLMGMPESARGVLTSGGSMSNLVAIVTARTARLPERFQDGVLYVSKETHQSAAKAARIAGFPASAIRHVEVDARGRMDPESLAQCIDRDRAAGALPFLVVASAGTTNTGAIDPLLAIHAIAKREGLWMHTDAAYGGFFRMADAARFRGIEESDSITLDPHKGLFLPYGTGCLLVRDPEALRRAHASEAEYLRDVTAEDGAIDFTDLSPELSRDFRGLRLWLPIMLHGLAAFRAQLEEKLALANVVYEALRADPHFEIVDEPQLSIVAFRLRAPAAESDARNAELLRRVNARKRVFLSSTTLGGRLTLRVCILSFRTHADRVDEAINALREEGAAIAARTA